MMSLLFIFVVFFFCTDDALPQPRTRGPKIPATTPAMDPAMTQATTPAKIPFNFTYYDPIFGALTAPQDIQDFVASVFAPRAGRRRRKPKPPGSGEFLKPKDKTNAAHVGYEQYWPGGEWVFRKAELDRCNSTGSACREVFKKYGKVCAANHDLTLHTTFESICDMYDTNCWDGTFSTFTTAGKSNVVWIPIRPSGHVDIKLATASTSTQTGFILTPTRSLDAKPRWSFQYGTPCKISAPQTMGEYEWISRPNFTTTTNSCIEVNELRYFGEAYIAFQKEFYAPLYPTWHFPECWDFKMHPSLGPEKNLGDKKVREFRLQWNQASRSVGIRYFWKARKPKEPGYSATAVKDWGFAAQYFGIWGGTPEEPTWWEISGIPRGFMVAYRGECQTDLPTIPLGQSLRLAQDIDIKMYNFAERMDDFGYNYSRKAKNNSDTYYMADKELYDSNLYS